MKKLEPIFQLINAVVLERLAVRLRLGEDSGVNVESAISKILLGLQSDPKASAEDNGLLIEDLDLGVEDLQLPSPGSPGISLTFRIDQVTLKFSPAFWPRAAVLAKERLVSNMGKLLDRIHLRNLKVKVSLDINKILDAEVWMEHQEITLAGKAGITVDDVHVLLEGMNLQEKNKKLAMKQSRLTLFSATTRVSGDVLNRGVDVARNKIPSMVQSIDFDLSYERMLVTTKLSVFPMAIPTELTFMANNNQFGIYIVKVLIGLARPVILGLLNKAAKNKPEINVSGDKLFIDIWSKVPIPVVCNLSQFAINDGKIVVAFSPPAKLPERLRQAPVIAESVAQAIEEEPKPEEVPVEATAPLPPLP